MSIFSTIMDKIFHHPTAASQQAAVAPAAQATRPVAPTGAPPAAPASAAPAQSVDVEAVLSGIAADKGGGGDWQSSIVDLLKLLDIDSSLNARHELAGDLSVHAGPDGSAEQNIALHKAVMQKLAENGGVVPASLRT